MTYQVGDARDATVPDGQEPALRDRSSGDGPDPVQVTVAGPDVAVPAPPT